MAISAAVAVLFLGLRADALRFAAAQFDGQGRFAQFSADMRGLGRAVAHGPTDLLQRIHNGASLLVSGTAEFDRHREAALQDIKEAVPLDYRGRSVDFYNIRQGLALANGLAWDPRPVFQSFVAFTPALESMNTAHLEGANAPQEIYFRLETIDGRLPALDDGSSWPVLRSRYEIVGVVGDYAHLSRRAHPEAVSMQPLAPAKIAFGEVLKLDDRTSSIYAQLETPMTWFGRLLSLVYKPPAIHIHVTTSAVAPDVDFEQRVFRLVPGEAASGFVLSPLITSNSDFVAWMRGSKGVEVRSIDIRANWLARLVYSTPFAIRLWRFDRVDVLAQAKD
jgi:hypothetical protein